MKKNLLIIVFFLCSLQGMYSQDGVVAFDMPIRNSLKFNRYIINPTFSFVREKNSYISFYNKRQWIQFDDAPQTYLFGYSGRFRENEGIAVGLFQQNYGLLTTFGGIVNFAHNVELQEDSNLTFGVNLGFYKSGINASKAITNNPEPSLQNVPSNTLITLNPGINYGTAFLDFGVSVNNVILYNLKTSKLIADNPAKSIEGHIMYTGFMDSYGFFDKSKFSGILKAEKRTDKTIVSGLVAFTIPKGIWANAGYNSLYGMSAGLGLNITPKISIEYNFEKGIGNLSNFGSSHEIVLAYKFKGNNNDDDETEGSIIPPAEEIRTAPTKPKEVAEVKPKIDLQKERDLKLALKAKADADAKAKLENEKSNRERVIADAKAKLEADAKAKANADKAKLETERLNKERANANAKAKLEADAKAKTEADKAKLETERLNKERVIADAKAKLEADAKAKTDADKARLETERLNKEKAIAEAKAKAEIDAKAKLEAELLLKEKAIADAKAKSEIEKAQLEAELLRKEKEIADAKAKSDAIAKAKAEADAKTQLDAEKIRKEKEITDAKVKADADAKAKLDAAKEANEKSMYQLNAALEESKRKQKELLDKLESTLVSKEKDLKALKDENDSFEKGIVTNTEPKVFKSASAANQELETLKQDIDEAGKNQKESLAKYENLLKERLVKVPNQNDLVTQDYLKTIEQLKADKLKTEQVKSALVTKLDKIKEDIEIEKKRRIKRAAFDNEDVRYANDRLSLKQIKETTPQSKTPLKPEDFDYGTEEQSDNMQIIKNIANVSNGYYLVIAVHKDVAKRDAFLTKAVATGQKNIDFLYDVNSGKYFIYYDKYDSLEEAVRGFEQKGNKPYNGKMSVIKVENK